MDNELTSMENIDKAYEAMALAADCTEYATDVLTTSASFEIAQELTAHAISTTRGCIDKAIGYITAAQSQRAKELLTPYVLKADKENG